MFLSRIFRRGGFLLACILMYAGCSRLSVSETQNLPPISKPDYFDLEIQNEDSLRITMLNHLPVERYLILRSDIDTIQTYFDKFNPFIFQPEDSIRVSIFPKVDSTAYSEISGSIRGSSYIGNPLDVQVSEDYHYSLPVAKGREFKILQGQDASFTHNLPYNKYAVDFAMSVGDTVYAARDGIVAYLYEESSYGGNNRVYLPYSNALMILHDDGTIGQYSHLKKNGVLVEIGDQILVGQPVALSGNTGYVSGDHLHFNVLKPTMEELVSIFVSFSGYENQKFKKGDVVSH